MPAVTIISPAKGPGPANTAENQTLVVVDAKHFKIAAFDQVFPALVAQRNVAQVLLFGEFSRNDAWTKKAQQCANLHQCQFHVMSDYGENRSIDISFTVGVHLTKSEQITSLVICSTAPYYEALERRVAEEFGVQVVRETLDPRRG